MDTRACYPLGFDPEGVEANVCSARTPGPLGLNDAADPDASATMGPTPGTLGVGDAAACMADAGTAEFTAEAGETLSVHQGADEAMLIVEVEEKDPTVPGDSFLETTAENLARFAYDKRTDWPGALIELKSVAQALREFGGATFYVMKGKGKGKEGKRYLVFKGNPRNPGKLVGLRNMIKGNGPYSFKNPAVMEIGFGTKAALKAGARAFVVSFVVVAVIDVVAELMKDEFSLRRLGVQIGVDVANLIISGLAGLAASAAVAAGVVTAPVWLVAAAGLVVGLAVSYALDRLDQHFGITEKLQQKAEELQNQVEWGIKGFLMQMEYCVRNPYHCWGG